MKKHLQRHKEFLKDSKKTKITDKQNEKLFEYVVKLLNNEPLPKEARDHSLSGNWNDFREFHLGGDMLIIYQSTETHITLIRLGTHSQLF